MWGATLPPAPASCSGVTRRRWPRRDADVAADARRGKSGALSPATACVAPRTSAVSTTSFATLMTVLPRGLFLTVRSQEPPAISMTHCRRANAGASWCGVGSAPYSPNRCPAVTSWAHDESGFAVLLSGGAMPAGQATPVSLSADEVLGDRCGLATLAIEVPDAPSPLRIMSLYPHGYCPRASTEVGCPAWGAGLIPRSRAPRRWRCPSGAISRTRHPSRVIPDRHEH